MDQVCQPEERVGIHWIKHRPWVRHTRRTSEYSKRQHSPNLANPLHPKNLTIAPRARRHENSSKAERTEQVNLCRVDLLVILHWRRVIYTQDERATPKLRKRMKVPIHPSKLHIRPRTTLQLAQQSSMGRQHQPKWQIVWIAFVVGLWHTTSEQAKHFGTQTPLRIQLVLLASKQEAAKEGPESRDHEEESA